MRVFTSESVTEGHPDKVADAISDALLDAMLAQDLHSRVAVETLAANGVIVVSGEATTEAYVDVSELARRTLTNIGYDSPARGFDGNSCGVMVALNNQSPDIASGVAHSWELRHGVSVDERDSQGAGDQGMVFGYACDETATLMPTPIHLAHRLTQQLAALRHAGAAPHLRPDGKAQVSVGYHDDRPVSVTAVVVSAQHDPEVSQEQLADDIREQVVNPVLEKSGLEWANFELYVNPTGRFVIGGPAGDSGLTGRKIIVDTYGGMARHGGGAFSGKDPSKVDRCAAYALRYAAKNIVAAGLARRCELQVAYVIGKARPVGVHVETFGTGSVSDAAIQHALTEVFDLRPAAIIEQLRLLRPIYSLTTNYGHFGRELPEFTWENTDRVAELLAVI
ncbi:MAG: methionine adenosyltransferase [Propionibacteriaceae bacterium]|jgi:S-adenosylmethionine synthetase|nr:methionine adenosyltransferase [Propionibacteriaceae bacterium]